MSPISPPKAGTPISGPVQPKTSPARAVAPHVAAAIGRQVQAKPATSTRAPAAHVAAAIGARSAQLKPMARPVGGVVQRAKYVPPNKRAGAAAAAPPPPAPLHDERGRPLYNWLNAGPALTFSRVVNQVSDYVTIEIVERAHIHHAARHIQFNVHNFFGANPYLGSVWALGVYRCELNAQENPRAGTMLQLWRAHIARGPNPSLSYDAEDDEWDVYFDAD